MWLSLVSPSVLSITLQCALDRCPVTFKLPDWPDTLLQSRLDMVVGGADSSVNALSGGVAGAANIFTGFPFDTVKVRLQASPRGTYAGGIDCTRSILKFEGVCQAAFGWTVMLSMQLMIRSISCCFHAEYSNVSSRCVGSTEVLQPL